MTPRPACQWRTSVRYWQGAEWRSPCPSRWLDALRGDALRGDVQLERLVDRARPTALARERVLPVADALLPLVPGGLVRGISVQIDGSRDGIGSTSLALALLAGPSAAGSWTAAVGVPTLGLAAAAGFGVDLGRLVLVAPPPAGEWGTVVATLLDAFDVVVARPPEPGRVRPGDARRLAARARERGSVLVRLAGRSCWPEAADLCLTVTATSWEGLGQGDGHLRARRAVVEATGRRGHDRPRRAELLLPGPGGVLATAPPMAAAPPMADCAALPRPICMMTAVRTLVLHVDDWPVVAAGAAPDEPAAVMFANRVVAATPAARADGVEVGMRRRESQGRCPELAILDHDPGRDARSFEPVVAALAERIAPRIEVVTPGHLAFATRGPSRYFGGDAALAQLAAELAGGVLGRRAEPGVGIADGPFAALLAARASGTARAVGVVAPLGSPGFLAPQPVDALALAGVDRRVARRVPPAGPAHPRRRGRPRSRRRRRSVRGRRHRRPSPGLRARRAPAGHGGAPDRPRRPRRARSAGRAGGDRRLRRPGPGRRAGSPARCRRSRLHPPPHRRRDRARRAPRAPVAGRRRRRCRRTHRRCHRRPRPLAARGLDHGTGGTSSTPTAGICLLELVPDEVVAATGRQLGFWGGTAGADERAVRAVARVAGLLGLEAVTVPEWRGGRSPAEQVVLVPAAAVDLVADRPSARPPPPAPPPFAPPPFAPRPAATRVHRRGPVPSRHRRRPSFPAR